MAAIWERSKDTIEGQLAVVEQAAMAALEGRLDAGLRQQAHRDAHKLAGSLGTFGLSKASEVAREIELLVELGLRKPLIGVDMAKVLRLSELAVALRGEFECGLPAAASPPPEPEPDLPFLLVVGVDQVLSQRLDMEGGGRGLHVESVSSVDAARVRLDDRLPQAMLVGLSPDGSEAALKLIDETTAVGVPVVVLAMAGGFTDRLEAARFGGRAFLDDSTSPAEALDAVCELLEQHRSADMTVMAVDDDPTILAVLQALLEPQGHRVVGLGDPCLFWDTLQETRPDLLLLDIDMPNISGIELCRVLRNDRRWRHLPVLFLTANTDPQTVEQVFAAGADDYVVKPIVGPELTTRIANRLERVQLYRDRAETDVLTGVATQSKSAEVMDRLIRMADRHRQSLCVAMIDLDQFKAVNDEHGHRSGDNVLAWLGKLLLRAFHREDLVARWAGEEFFVAMYGITRGDGVQRVAEVLEAVRQQRFTGSVGRSFGVSFSAGVAQYPEDGPDLQSLYRSADQASREAKKAGGDRVLGVGWQGAHDGASGTYDIALVEDDEVLAGLLIHALETRGRGTRWLSDGEEAAAALAGPSPRVRARVILLDWNLPGLDGLRVLRRLKETGVLRGTRVIMLTARAAEPEVLQALELGAFDHVAKPFSVPVLVQRIHRALES